MVLGYIVSSTGICGCRAASFGNSQAFRVAGAGGMRSHLLPHCCNNAAVSCWLLLCEHQDARLKPCLWSQICLAVELKSSRHVYMSCLYLQYYEHCSVFQLVLDTLFLPIRLPSPISKQYKRCRDAGCTCKMRSHLPAHSTITKIGHMFKVTWSISKAEC